MAFISVLLFVLAESSLASVGFPTNLYQGREFQDLCGEEARSNYDFIPEECSEGVLTLKDEGAEIVLNLSGAEFPPKPQIEIVNNGKYFKPKVLRAGANQIVIGNFLVDGENKVRIRTFDTKGQHLPFYAEELMGTGKSEVKVRLRTADGKYRVCGYAKYKLEARSSAFTLNAAATSSGYIFKGVPKGKYILTVDSLGADAESNLEVKGNLTVDVKLERGVNRFDPKVPNPDSAVKVDSNIYSPQPPHKLACDQIKKSDLVD